MLIVDISCYPKMNQAFCYYCSVSSGPHFIILLVVIVWNLDIKWKISNILSGELVYIVNLSDKALGHASHNLMGLWSISATGSIIKLWKLTVNFDSRPHGLCPGDKFKIIWCMPEDFIAREQIVLENELPIFRAQRSRFSINVSLIVWSKSSS